MLKVILIGLLLLVPAQDTVAPVIAIVAPSNGTILEGNYQLYIYCTTADDIGVDRVGLFVDGALLQIVGPPFVTRWNGRKAAAGPHTIYLRAWDVAGNYGTSQPITVYR